MAKSNRLKANFIDHINMNVKNLEESVTFYSELFGFEVRKDQPDLNSKIIGNDNIKLCLYEDPELEMGSGIKHFGFYIDNFEEVEEKCKALDIRMPYGTVEWGRSKSIYIVDPTGYEIELSKIQGGGL